LAAPGPVSGPFSFGGLASHFFTWRIGNTIEEEFSRALAYTRCRLARARVEHGRALDGLDTSDPNAVRSVAKLEADIAVAENEVTLLEAMVPKAGAVTGGNARSSLDF
jgi:hypothetical protein